MHTNNDINFSLITKTSQICTIHNSFNLTGLSKSIGKTMQRQAAVLPIQFHSWLANLKYEINFTIPITQSSNHKYYNRNINCEMCQNFTPHNYGKCYSCNHIYFLPSRVFIPRLFCDKAGDVGIFVIIVFVIRVLGIIVVVILFIHLHKL